MALLPGSGRVDYANNIASAGFVGIFIANDVKLDFKREIIKFGQFILVTFDVMEGGWIGH